MLYIHTKETERPVRVMSSHLDTYEIFQTVI